MINENQESIYRTNNIFEVFIGMLIGALAGSITMLLLAPKSGEETRMQIQKKGIELRKRTSGIVEDAIAQVRLDRSKLTIAGREKIKDLKQQGQELIVEQLDHVSEAAQAGKKAIQNS